MPVQLLNMFYRAPAVMLNQASTAALRQQLPFCTRHCSTLCGLRVTRHGTTDRRQPGWVGVRYRRQLHNIGTAFDHPVVVDKSAQRVGLFGYEGMESPEAMRQLVQDKIAECKDIYAAIMRATPGDLVILDLVDHLSDTACKVADPCNFIRQASPDPDVRQAAHYAVEALHAYLTDLNTDVALYEAINGVKYNNDEESERTLLSLITDFERYGIHLKGLQQAEVVRLGNSIQNLEIKFDTGIETLGSTMTYDDKDHGRVTFKLDPNSLATVLMMTDDPNQRKALYEKAFRCPAEHANTLEELLYNRHSLAKTVGFQSFGHMELRNNMAKTPDNVHSFLAELRRALAPRLDEEMNKLLQVQKDVGKSTAPSKPNRIKDYDRSFYLNFALYDQRSKLKISEYFSIGDCISGLNLVSESVFGVSFQPVAPLPGETWHNDVRKFELIHDTEGLLGILYFDLFERPGKMAGAAHYTIQTHRQVSDKNGSFSHYQNPRVVLSCSFTAPKAGHPSLLSMQELDSLFHEMGHAMHSIFARTKYHNIAGTRSVLDFVELPSTLFEYFIRDFRVVSQFARHYKSREVVPEELFQAAISNDKKFIGLTMLDSLIQSMIDQKLHSPSVESQSSVDAVLQIQSEYNPMEDCTAPIHYRHHHLTGYATGYYSYLWSTALSSMVWQECFSQNPLSRKAGDRYREKLLAPGGGRDPWISLEDLLGYKPEIHDMVEALAAKAE